MITIRNSQLLYFKDHLGEAFVGSLVNTIEKNHPGYTALFVCDELTVYVRHGVAKAKDIGLTQADELLRFVSLLLVVGWYFDRYIPFADLLYGNSADETPSERFAWLVDVATIDDWRNAASFSSEMLDIDPPDWIAI